MGVEGTVATEAAAEDPEDVEAPEGEESTGFLGGKE
jgi:hypothetical protein